MTNSEILKKAIKKAMKNGYDYPYETFLDSNFFGEEVENECYFSTIFFHSFAKAFWGEEIEVIKIESAESDLFIILKQPKWEYHLQQMVLEPEPLKYIEKFL